MNFTDCNSSSRYAVLRLTEQSLRDLETLLFRRYPQEEWATFIRFGYRRTTWGLVLTLVDLIPPDAGDLDEGSPIVVLKARYSRRALIAAENGELAIGVIHSHPKGCHVAPSSLDDEMDDYFAGEFAAYSGGAPYVSAIFARDEIGHLQVSGRIVDGDDVLPLREMFVVGTQLQRLSSPLIAAAPTTVEMPLESPTARLESVYGEASARILRESTAGIVGCSGTGSPAAHVLARAGVCRFVLVDFDDFSPSNHERFHASTWKDCIATTPRKKNVMLAELIRSINPNAEIVLCQGNVLDEHVLDELLRCDFLLGCTDTHHARLALSEYAIHYNLPVLDTGVLMEGEYGIINCQTIEVTEYGPALPCALCGGTINTQRLNVELMSPQAKAQAVKAAELANAKGLDGTQYWNGEPPTLPTVGYLTTTAGALLAGYAIGKVTGAFATPASRFQFDIGFPHLGYVAVPRRLRTTCRCGTLGGWADQARAYRNVARPDHFAEPEFARFPKSG
ncbi:MAG: ThiF family adenylyltransferase [Chthoniobacter sp.]|uniref:ThiF family adenylyltransferase n=1 Tax=Chthoniobacter sp. TaxID=2510640 RepID=UPI0032AC6422